MRRVLIQLVFVFLYELVMLNAKSKNPGVVSIKKICDGLEITVKQFFDSPLFDDTEQEIK